MTTDLETINGHQYLVTRDDAGAIVTMVGQDPIPVIPDPVTTDTVITQAKSLLSAPAATMTLSQVATMLQATLRLLLIRQG